MDNNQRWWNDFWAERNSATVSLSDDCATWYDLIWHECFNYWQKIFGELAPGKNMLECGCGTAKVSKYMASQGYNCTMLDYCEKAITLAKDNFKRSALAGNYVVGDIKDIKFSDGEFDIVYSGGVLEFFDDVSVPIKEMARVLKPGGIFAANMVPDKFSIQSVADIERTLVYSARNLIKGRFREAFNRVRTVPSHYNVSSLPIDGYIDICEKAGLKQVVGLVTSPFPELALPRFGKKLYAGIMKKMLKQWRAFDESQSRLSKIWGIKHTIYGIKGSGD